MVNCENHFKNFVIGSWWERSVLQARNYTLILKILGRIMQYTLEFALFWFILFQNLIRNSNIIKYSDSYIVSIKNLPKLYLASYFKIYNWIIQIEQSETKACYCFKKVVLLISTIESVLMPQSNSTNSWVWSVVGHLHARCLSKLLYNSPPQLDRGEDIMKGSWVRVKFRERSLSNHHHGQNRLDLGKSV